MIINSDRFKHLRFERSKTNGKKYDAIVQDIINKKTVRVPFGNKNYPHYNDITGLKLYSYLDTNNIKDQKAYLEIYKKMNIRRYSPMWFNSVFLNGC